MSTTGQAFASLADLDAWLATNHAHATELWVRIGKKSGKDKSNAISASVTWADCVVAALTWGWIDGQKRALDDAAFVQRLTPRRARSSWSKRNCEIAERLIAEGRMQPAGLLQVQAAQADGRWEQAYAGSATMVLPDDFLQALEQNAAAKQAYASLKKAAQFSIYLRLHTAKRAETRAKRMVDVITKLENGERGF